MARLKYLFRYATLKFDYSVSAALKSYKQGQIGGSEVPSTILRNIRHGKMTFLHTANEKDHMTWIKDYATRISSGDTLLVRKIPAPNFRRVRKHDLVVLKDPQNTTNYLVRRLDATYATKYNPVSLKKDECWVLADRNILDPDEAYDSRTFGPVNMENIVGRAIYVVKSAENLSDRRIKNSFVSFLEDLTIVEVELDVDRKTL